MKLLVVLVFLIVLGCKENETRVDAQHIELEMKKIDQDTVGKDYLMGKFDPKNHPDFVAVDIKYADRNGMYLRREVMEAFVKMYEEAKAVNINLIIKSATRNFDYQKGIWERKWSGATTLSDGTNLGEVNWSNFEKALKILEYSSMPGTSRHHWGTDFDVNAFENEWFERGEGKNIYEWLSAHAEKYGFVQVYTPKGVDRPDGYNEEKWHWSYKPTASKYIKEAQRVLSNEDISGFLGSETAQEIDVVNKYILGVQSDCY